MRPSIASVVAAILLAGTFAAHAQDTDAGAAPPKARTAHHVSHNDRKRVRRRATPTPSTASRAPAATDEDEEFPQPNIPRGSAGGPLPNYFKNCEEPIVPRFCAQ
jgi:Rod binding domain-containing protein